MYHRKCHQLPRHSHIRYLIRLSQITWGASSRWQTSADKDSESPDSSVLSLSGRTDRQRTEFFREIRTKPGQRTESRQTESGQTDTGQLYFSKSGQNPDTGQNRDRQNPDRQTTDRESGQRTDMSVENSDKG